MEFDVEYRISVLEGGIAQLTRLVNKLLTEKSNPSDLERRVAKLAVRVEKLLTETSDASVLGGEVTRLNFYAGKLLAEKSNPSLDPNGEQLAEISKPPMEPNREELDNHRQATISNEPSVMEHSHAGQVGTAIGQQQLSVPQMNHEQLDHHPQAKFSNESSEMEHSDADHVGPAIGQQQLNVPQINREQLVADHRPPCIESEVIHESPNRIAAAHGQHGANFSGNIVLCPKMEHEEAHDFQHSLKALIAKLCADADADRDGSMQLILQNLLKEPGYAALYKWEPRNKTIVAAQTRIVAWILHPEHIHMFKDNESIKDVRGQVPLGNMLHEVFFECICTKNWIPVKDALSSAVRRRTSPFAKFLSAVVEVHSRCCSICNTL